MTEGVIWKQIFFFTLPLLAGNLFQQLYNTVDSIVVGNYVGQRALAAVAASTPIVNIIVGFFMGMSAGASIVISMYFGARDRKGLRRSVHASMLIAAVLGLILTFIGIFISPLSVSYTHLDVYKRQEVSSVSKSRPSFTCHSPYFSRHWRLSAGMALSLIHI